MPYCLHEHNAYTGTIRAWRQRGCASFFIQVLAQGFRSPSSYLYAWCYVNVRVSLDRNLKRLSKQPALDTAHGLLCSPAIPVSRNNGEVSTAGLIAI